MCIKHLGAQLIKVDTVKETQKSLDTCYLLPLIHYYEKKATVVSLIA